MSGFFVHPNALCETRSVGAGTRIWAFAHILPGAIVGRDCNICDHVFIENEVVLGNRVTVKSGVQLWNGLVVEDDVFIGPNATFSNDPFPRSKQYQQRHPVTTICRSASIGANATILPGLTIGQNAMIGAGSVVTSNVQPNAIVTGNPARVTGYADMTRSKVMSLTAGELAAVEGAPVAATEVAGVTLHRLLRIDDIRGNLSVGEFTRQVPFTPARYFTIFDVPGTRVRGEHALRSCEQFLVSLRGSCAIVVDDGKHRQEILLGGPDYGLHIPPMTWTTLYKFSADAILLVLASTFYDPADYIRDYQSYLAGVAEAEPSAAAPMRA